MAFSGVTLRRCFLQRGHSIESSKPIQRTIANASDVMSKIAPTFSMMLYKRSHVIAYLLLRTD